MSNLKNKKNVKAIKKNTIKNIPKKPKAIKNKDKEKSTSKQKEMLNNIYKEMYKEIDTIQNKILKRIDIGITIIFGILTIFLIYVTYKILFL